MRVIFLQPPCRSFAVDWRLSSEGAVAAMPTKAKRVKPENFILLGQKTEKIGVNGKGQT